MDGPGYFYQPTVLGDVPNDAEILGQEIFGPVAPVTTLVTEDDAIRLADDSEYGLAFYLYGRDFNRLLRVAEQIEFGMVGFNAGVISNAAAPFGEVKQSGWQRGHRGVHHHPVHWHRRPPHELGPNRARVIVAHVESYSRSKFRDLKNRPKFPFAPAITHNQTA